MERKKERKKEMEVRAAQKRRVGGCGGNRGRLSEVRFQCTTQREGTREEVRGWRRGAVRGAIRGRAVELSGSLPRAPASCTDRERERTREKGREYGTWQRKREKPSETDRTKEKDGWTEVELEVRRGV